MSECFLCERGMNVADGCTPDRKIVIDDVMYNPIRYGENNPEYTGRCHDCGTKVGEYHHPGCDMERCPSCGGQYFVCPCVTDEKEEIWGEVDV